MAAGWLIASVLSFAFGREGASLGFVPHFLLGGAIFFFVMLLRRRRAAQAQPQPQPVGRTVAAPSRAVEPPVPVTIVDRSGEDSSLDAGLRDIRRMDGKFDPARFTGYIETVVRTAHSARMSRDVASLRDRVTPELYVELQARCGRWPSLPPAGHAEPIDVRAQVTEAWQEDGRDYLTAYVEGSTLQYTVDEVTDGVVDGSKTAAGDVAAFWTFTRPAGLNPWMLSAIQTS